MIRPEEYPTLTDELDTEGISWRYYAPSAGSIWRAPDAIRHVCQPQTQSGQLHWQYVEPGAASESKTEPSPQQPQA